MSKKARRRPSWSNKKRRDPRIDRLPYNKYWCINFYDWFDAMAEQYMSMPENRQMVVSKAQADIMKKLVFNGT